MDYTNQYLENLPSIYYGLLCAIPTITYFVSVKLYLKFHKKEKTPEKKYIISSSKNMIGSSFANYFLAYPLFYNYSEIEGLTIFNILLGCLLIDTIEYWYHFLFHHNKYLYDRLHSVHHAPVPIHPLVSFANDDIEVLITSPVILVSTVFLGFTFIEYIIMTSMAFAATVCDHTYTSDKKFHYLHHCGNKKTNLQQPFFTFWDHINSTYNKKTLTKIPFVP